MCENTRILDNAPLAPYTTFGIGGVVRRLVITDSPQVLASELSGGECFVMGGGSNLLVGDKGCSQTVVRFCSEDCDLTDDGTGAFYVSGAARLPTLARLAAHNGYGGLEWAAGIPGTVGGAVRMNAGAFGGDMSGVVKYVDILRGGAVERVGADRLGFSYRHSHFDGVVVGAALSLTRDEPKEIETRINALMCERRLRQPIGKSAGSVYKSCRGIPAYRYIVGAGLQGASEGGAAVSEKHANFIINTSDARARDVLKLMIRIETEVYNKFGVRLEREIELIGEF